MQLKMKNTFNVKLVKELIRTEDRFLADLFKIMPLHVSELAAYTEKLDNNDHPGKRTKIPSTNGKAKRARTFEELYQKLDELKGRKKLDRGKKLLKKGLKNRLKKKTKKEERSGRKKTARAERQTSNVVGTKSEDEATEAAPKIPKAKPIFNSQGNMVFSKFDFSEIGTKKRPPKNEKDPEKALRLLRKKEERSKELKEAGEIEKASEMKEKDAWRAVLARSSGEKVKDDPELLKRSIKRAERQKVKSAKKWESRLEGVRKQKEESQQKRQDNIRKRKKEKKTNKLKKASKKGRVIPGF